MLFSRTFKIILAVALCASMAVAAKRQLKKSTKKRPKRPHVTRPTPQTKPDPRFAQWAAVKKPTPDTQTEIYGGYARGCIAGAVPLPAQNPNYTIVNLNDSRIYGHPNLIKFITDLSAYLRSKSVPAILIEDMSAPRGGPVIKGHASHQNGLDVDISFSLPKKPLTLAERAKRPEVSFIKERRELLPTWTSFQTLLVVAAVRTEQVDRVFVAPAIKKFMCDKFPTAPWLYKLRAWWGHEDHLHVRLKCPVDQENCVPQDLDEEDIQCGPSLDKWLKNVAPKAKKIEPLAPAPAPAPVAKPTPPPTPVKVTPTPPRFKRFPSLPPECERVVKD